MCQYNIAFNRWDLSVLLLLFVKKCFPAPVAESAYLQMNCNCRRVTSHSIRVLGFGIHCLLFMTKSRARVREEGLLRKTDWDSTGVPHSFSVRSWWRDSAQVSSDCWTPSSCCDVLPSIYRQQLSLGACHVCTRFLFLKKPTKVVFAFR